MQILGTPYTDDTGGTAYTPISVCTWGTEWTICTQ